MAILLQSVFGIFPNPTPIIAQPSAPASSNVYRMVPPSAT
jgi:hypothetical protein